MSQVGWGGVCKGNLHQGFSLWNIVSVLCEDFRPGSTKSSIYQSIIVQCSIRSLAWLCVLLYLVATRWLSSVTLGMWRSVWSSWWLMYQGAFTVFLRNFDWNRWIIFILVGLAHPHNWTPGKWCNSFSDLCSSSGCLFPAMVKTGHHSSGHTNTSENFLGPFNLIGQELQISPSSASFPTERRRNVPFKKWREAPNWCKVKWSQSPRGYRSVKCMTFFSTLKLCYQDRCFPKLLSRKRERF